MARRGQEYARLTSGGGYTQALAVGKGFSGAERRAAKEGGSLGLGSRSTAGTVNAFARHQELIRNYHRYHLNAKVPSSGAIEAKGLPGQKRLTDEEVLRRQHRFVRDDDDDKRAHQAKGLEGAAADPSAWEVRMASKYYKMLFKEYALADLSRYREDKVGLRWRTEKDVVSGKGQFECGALRCQERNDLHSYELNFRYKEAGEVKNELVKVRVCPQCARKLFRKKIEALRRQRHHHQQQLKAKQLRAKDSDEGGESEESGRPRQRTKLNGGGGAGTGSESSGGTEYSDGGEGSSFDLAEGGHDLVCQAMAAAGGESGGGTVSAATKKRNRPTRWGEKTIPSEAAIATRGGESSSGSRAGVESRAGGAGGDGALGDDEALRQAWAGELQRDRTAEDEMDDYLSSLLL